MPYVVGQSGTIVSPGSVKTYQEAQQRERVALYIEEVQEDKT